MNLENSEGWTPLFLAINRNDAPFVDQLLTHGADPFHMTSTGKNALHFAAQKGRANIIRRIQALSKASGLKKGTRRRHKKGKKAKKTKTQKVRKTRRLR